MPPRDPDPDARLRYARLMDQRPELRTNPPAGGIEVLTRPDEIAAAESAAMDALRARGQPPDYARVGIMYENEYFQILRDAVRFPDGLLGTYVRIVMREEVAPGSAVLALMQGRVALVRHFRHATRTWHLEIPRGFLSPGLSPAENARREIAEEIGAQVLRLEPLGIMHVNTGLGSELVELYYAEVDQIGGVDRHEGILAVELVELTQFEQMIARETITDSFTIAAYCRAKLKGLIPSLEST